MGPRLAAERPVTILEGRKLSVAVPKEWKFEEFRDPKSGIETVRWLDPAGEIQLGERGLLRLPVGVVAFRLQGLARLPGVGCPVFGDRKAGSRPPGVKSRNPSLPPCH
jgi:hypothetical protein